MDFDFTVITSHARFLGSGIVVTLLLSILSGLSSLAVGFVVALARLYGPRGLKPLVVLYIDSMRAIPVLVVLVWTFFALPIVTGITMPPFWAALIGLTVHLAAYVAEIVRSGVESVRPGQTRAAMALGMSRAQALRRIILPQASRRILPVLASTWVSLFKDTSLVSVMAVTELAYVAMQIRAQTFRVLEMLTAMAAIYWLLGYPQAKLVDWIQRRFAVTE